jgi:osmoprotectant transport system ATP-binding protein
VSGLSRTYTVRLKADATCKSERPLAEVTLAIEAGEVVALVGRSGAGKTTLMKLVNRLLLPDRGEVIVRGENTRDADPIRLRRSIGYVIQDAGLFPHLTVADNIAVVPRLERWPAERITARIAELLDLVGLPSATYAARWPAELSGGQRQRVGVARALAAEPKIMLLDEPFGALDPLTRDRIQETFLKIKRSLGLTAMFVTHDMGEALLLADRIAVMRRGQLVQVGTPRELVQSPADADVERLLDTPRRHARHFEGLLDA